MRIWISGPRLFGGMIRPGISFSSPRAGVSRFNVEAPAAFVYVIRGRDDHRKVGVSTNPNRRLRQLQTGSPVPLVMEFCAPVYGASAFDVETEAHAIMRDRRISGEWFDISLNIAVAAIYGAAERAGASMQPTAASTEPPGWWQRRGILSRVAMFTISGTMINVLVLNNNSGSFLLWWVIVGSFIIVFT